MNVLVVMLVLLLVVVAVVIAGFGDSRADRRSQAFMARRRRRAEARHRGSRYAPASPPDKTVRSSGLS